MCIRDSHRAAGAADASARQGAHLDADPAQPEGVYRGHACRLDQGAVVSHEPTGCRSLEHVR
eukprot:7029058-Prymnesium_polylepis.1